MSQKSAIERRFHHLYRDVHIQIEENITDFLVRIHHPINGRLLCTHYIPKKNG